MPNNMFDERLDTPVWGAYQIAEVLGLKTDDGHPDARKVYYLAAKKLIDCDKVGEQLTSTRRRLLRKHLQVA